MKETRAFKAGEKMGKAIVEMVHLMYQNNTAAKFLSGLINVLVEEYKKRGFLGNNCPGREHQ